MAENKNKLVFMAGFFEGIKAAKEISDRCINEYGIDVELEIMNHKFEKFILDNVAYDNIHS